MNNYGELVRDVTYEIDSLKNTIINGQLSSITTQGLLCESKKRIVDTYLTSINNLSILITSLCQMLICFKSIDEVNSKLSHIKTCFRNTFNNNIIDAIQEGEHCSGCPKSTVLFVIMQNQLEDIFFAQIANKVIPYIGSTNGEKFDICQEILDDLQEFSEAALLHLSGLRINCSSIKDNIFEDIRFPVNRSNIKRLSLEEYDQIPDMPPSGCLFKDDKRIECLHIFLYDGMLKIKSWMDIYTDLYFQYHKYSKRINLILDYKLVTEYSWSQKDMDRYIHLKDVFGEVFIINSNHIDFGKFVTEVHITEYDKIEECFIECEY